ncbi:MAG: InlB B-repeat-containing protein [Paludibacteraceae bacterium]|nr:InlB B-repeat-containing protein [Paludibacteraceae bacterium]
MVVEGSWTINQYPVTFYNEEGEVVWTDTLDYQASFKDGYERNVQPQESYLTITTSQTFIEWSPSLGDTLVPAGGVEFYPIFDGSNYYFRFYDVDSTKVLREIRVTSAAKVNTYVPTERHEGCQFDHWNRFDGSEVSTWPIQINSADDSVIAVYDTLSYDIQFKYGDGSDSILKKEAILFKRPVVYPANPTREGYTFVGWSEEIDVMPAENTVITAMWQINIHEVVYMSVIDGVEDEAGSRRYEYGKEVTSIDMINVEGYTFYPENWFDEAGNKIDFANFTMPDKDTTIYGVYTPNEYQLTYLDYNDTILCETGISYNRALRNSYCSNPTREGYVFTGWSENLPATMPAHNVTLKAQYEIDTFQVIIKGCNDTIIEVVYDSVIDSLPYQTLEGRYFLGWRDAEIDGDSIEFPFNMPAHDTVIYCNGSGYANYEYVLTFLDYNDTVLYCDTLEYSETVGSYADPTREGWTFIGWSDEIPVTMPAHVVTLKANYSINSYPVTFYDYDHSLIKTDTLEFGSKIVIPENVQREGYSFIGWDPANIPAVVPADTIEFFAQYEINNYVVTFVDGVDNSVIEKPSFEYNASVVYPTVPVHEGYTFIEWVDSLDVMPAANKTITATYQINVHSVTFMNDTVVKKITGNYGTAVTKPADLKREGYTFNGWDKEVPTTIPDSDVVLNAQFTINDYYVFFLDWNNDTLLIDTVKYNSSDIDFPAQPKREGYRFTGYIDPAPSVMPAHNVTCKAQYVLDQFTVKFVDFNGNVIKTIRDNFGTTVVAPSNPKREGYTFTGWSDTIPATIPAKNVTLTAQYEINSYLLTFTFKETVLAKDSVEFGAEVVRPNYTPEVGYHFVSWSDNDTIEFMPAKDVTISVKVDADLHSITTRDFDSTLIKQYTSKYGSELNIPDPSREGYTFAGWSEEIPATMPAKDMVVYAQYTPNEYTITYKDDDQSIIKVDTFNYRDTIVKIADPEHTGYTFTGWSAEIPVTMPINGLEVVAQYQINNYIIAFRTQEGVNIETKNHTYNSELVAPGIPDKVGYSILGWDKDVPAVVPAHNDTFYAQYSINQYIFSFEDKDGTIYKRDTLDYGAAIVAPADPTKEGYTFDGWDIAIPSVIPNMNITTLAQWEANPYVLSFVDYNDSIIELDTLKFGAEVVYPTDPVREGYTFAGWADSIDVMPAHDDSLIAQYTINKYIVIIQDGDSIIYKDTLNYGDSIKAPKDLEKEGYEFAGWEPELPETVPAKDIIVTPIWTKAEFVITFLDYNDTILAQDTLLYQANVVAPKPTREGYTFTGYDPAAPAKMPGKDLTCVAQYTINKHIIVFEDGDGNEIFRDTLVYGDPIIAPSDPTKDGYQFDGWNPVVPATVPDQDLTIVPQFSKSDFVITFLDFDSTEIFKDTLSFDAKIASVKDPKREGYTFAGWDPVVPTKMPGNDFTTVAQYTINKHVIVIIDGDDELFRDTLTFGDPINVDTVPTKEGFTFAGWDPIIPATVPDSDIVAYSTWIEDSLVLKSVDAFADNFCAGDVAQVYYTVTSGKPLSFSITFDEASKKAGFKTQTGKIGEDGEIFMEIPAGIEEGVYTATLQLIGVDSVSNSVKFNFSTNISSRYISRMWDDVVVVDNFDEEFDSYQWYKNGEKIEGATKQFYCELGGLDGFYSVIVKTKDGKEKHICGIQCDYVLPPFSIVAYPNPAKANVEFTLEVKGLTEEELAIAKIYIYTVSGTIAHTEREIEYKNLVSLPQGEYIALVVVEGKSAFCKVLVR